MVRSWGHRGYRRGWFGLGGADILARLGHVTFDGLVRGRAIFGGILVGETWPRSALMIATASTKWKAPCVVGVELVQRLSADVQFA